MARTTQRGQVIDVDFDADDGQDPQVTRVGEGAVVDFDPAGSATPQPAPDQTFYSNLADRLSPADLSVLARDVITYVRADAESRAPWVSQFERGLILMGVMKDTQNIPFDGASTAIHPLFAEAVIQYQARALEELLPAQGPAKARVVGQVTPERTQQAERVEAYMNYQMMTEDRAYFLDSDRMLHMQGLYGSQFRKVYKDAVKKMVLSRHVPGHRFLMPYSAMSLDDAPRYTHIIPKTPNDLKREMAAGMYLRVAVSEPSALSAVGSETGEEVQVKIRQVEDRVDPGLVTEDGLHILLECYLYRQFEIAEAPEQNAPDFNLPYVVTVDLESEAVLSVRRNWLEKDRDYNKIISFVHYPFVSGPGAYSYGYVHLLGAATEAASGILRELMDAGSFAALQGGFKSKDAKLLGEARLIPGLYIDTGMTAEDLSKAFYTPPFREPPVALFNTLGLLVDATKSLGSVTDPRTGEANNTGPVGTTVALIEQGEKIHTAIHKRNHQAMAEELMLRFRLNGDTLPDEYPYDVEGESRTILRADFDRSIDVIPVSDPNIVSSTQRIAIAQTGLDLAAAAPALYDMRAVHRRLHEAIKTPNIDELMPDPQAKIGRLDPVSEGQLMLAGRPIRAFPDQNHAAHLIVHQQFMAMLAGISPEHAQVVMPMAMAHNGEHIAYQYRMQAEQMIGRSLPPVSLYPTGAEDEPESLPPELDAEISAQAAAAANQALAEQSPSGGELSPEDEAAIAEQARADYAMERDQEREDRRLAADEARRDTQSASAVARQLDNRGAPKPSSTTKDADGGATK